MGAQPYDFSVTEIHPDQFRISDSERENAISALGEHMSTGRLGIDEYGERTAQVTVARTRGELKALFTDLPEPKPRFDVGASKATTRSSTVDVNEPARRGSRSPQRSRGRFAPVLRVVRIALLAAIGVLIFTQVFFPLVIFLAVLAIMSSKGGGGRRWDHRHWDGPGGSSRGSDHRSHPAFSAGYNSRSYRGRQHRGSGFQGHARA